jgi:peptide/nickel transport system permease protein
MIVGQPAARSSAVMLGWTRWFGKISRTRIAQGIAVAVIAGVVALAVAPAFISANPNAGQLADRLLPPGSLGTDGQRHWLGTDELGRDVLLRLMVGSRTTLVVCVLALALGACVGILIGLVAAAREGHFLSVLLMRLSDAQNSFPFLVLAITVVAGGGGRENGTVGSCSGGWPLRLSGRSDKAPRYW